MQALVAKSAKATIWQVSDSRFKSGRGLFALSVIAYYGEKVKNSFDAAQELVNIKGKMKEIEDRFPQLYSDFVESMFERSIESGDDPKSSANGQFKIGYPMSNRDRVRQAGKGGMLNIDDLASKSGLTKKQVRGVINAPGEKDNWAREGDPSGNGLEKLYGYRPESK